jgi:hypothetical protein
MIEQTVPANLLTGKTAARPGAVSFKFSRYFDLAALPTPPRRFGHYQKVQQWGELGNDIAGDCVWAGAGHETMLWNAANKRPINITAANSLSDYSALTGYSPSKPFSDRGTDMSDAADYRRKTGIVDAAGIRHTVDAYVSIHAGDIDTLMLATYLFGAVGFGMIFPLTTKTQFTHQQPWDLIPGAVTEGGHYISVVGRNSAGNILLVTWGRLHAMTPQFARAYNDENIAYLSLEWLDSSSMLTPDNFDRAALVKDLAALAA